MIKNLVFDMGNVLIHWKGELLMDWMGIDDKEERKILSERMFSSLEWPLLDWGVLNEEEAEKVFQSRIDRKYWDHIHKSLYWEDMIYPVEGMADFIRKKKADGYSIYLLSNAPASVRKYFPLIPSSECFDGIIFSGKVKLVKPMPEIYQLLLQRYSLKAEESLFIDDLPLNCAGAVHEGMKAFVFRENIDELERYLGSLNS